MKNFMRTLCLTLALTLSMAVKAFADTAPAADIAGAITTGISGILSQVTEIFGAVAPAAITIAGMGIVLSAAVGMFRRLRA